MEISPDGASLRPRSRFARFNNLPELQQMFRSFADVQTADMLDLPRPKLATGKPITVSCPMNAPQLDLQSELVERYERLRNERVDPREDNALAITTDGRKLALDARMLSADAEDDPNSKINALVGNVAQVWQESAATRGTQLIFCDMGVQKTPWGFSAYEDIIGKLVARGIPRDQIASIGDADSDARKQALFEKVGNGSIRILLGSTQKMGTGTNVQRRLVALHHLDAPWKPSEVEQRDGRILRQGNQNAEVAIYRYVTEGSFDAYMWQALETKARFINQIMTGNSTARSAEDIGGQELSYAEVKAIASGNPAVLTLAEADAEIQRLAILGKNHADDQFLIRRKLKELPDTTERLTKRRDQLEQDIATIAANTFTPMKIGSRTVLQDQAQNELGLKLASLPEHVNRLTQIPLGEIHGLKFGLNLLPNGQAPEVTLEGQFTRTTQLSRNHTGPRAILNAIARLESTYQEQLDKTTQDLALANQQTHDFQQRLGQPFADEDYLKHLIELRNQLRTALSDKVVTPANETHQVSTVELSNQINALRNSHTADDTTNRNSEKPHSTAEEPVTTRIHRNSAVLQTGGLADDDKPTAEDGFPATLETGPFEHLDAGQLFKQHQSRFRKRVPVESRSA